MQLKKIDLSMVTALLVGLSTMTYSENYVALEYLQYDESDDRISVSAPMVEVSYDFNSDYNLKTSLVYDAISGATPSFVTGSSGLPYRGFESFDDERVAGSMLLTSRFENRDELYTGIDYSLEEDYQSTTASLEYMHYTDASHNQSITFGGAVGFNQIKLYDSTSGASGYGDDYDEDSTTYTLQAGVTQVLSPQSSMKMSAFMIQEEGYLTNPHAVVVRDYGLQSMRLEYENRPDSRSAYGMTLNYNHYFFDKFALVGSYRLYSDDWDITSHTVELDGYFEVNEKVTLGVGGRYYNQSEADFYHGEIDYFSDEVYASSDERLSAFDAFTYKGSLTIKQSDTISYSIGAQFYQQNTQSEMSATMFTVGVKYKF
jgi:hypothetical protein